ncbi:MAG TPA: hypothetical protein VK553_10500 [Candidatus Nitrosopolaris rasttigaisensis]|nr:hypothetical protein [Candidatus Nitrosopolaris rasttigaisensis]
MKDVVYDDIKLAKKLFETIVGIDPNCHHELEFNKSDMNLKITCKKCGLFLTASISKGGG